MSWMPPPPTDSLYKFSAIWGLRMILGVLIFFGWLISVEMKINREYEASLDYFRSAMVVPSIERRIASLKQGDIEGNKLDWALSHWSPQDEQRILQGALKSHQGSMEKSKLLMNQGGC